MNGTPSVRPLFFEFPNERELFAVDEQFLIGRDILITPVLKPNATSVQGFFPAQDRIIWRDWYTHAVVNSTLATGNTMAGTAMLDAPLGHINVHIRDGSALLLYRDPKNTVEDTSKSPYELLVHLARDGYAHGSAYVDDGKSDPLGPATHLKITGNKGKLVIDSNGSFKINNKLEKVTLLGVASKPMNVTVGGKAMKFTYDASVQRVVMDGLSIDLNKDTVVMFS
jgi:alpha-glucosidase